MMTNFILLQAQGDGGLSSIIMIVALIAIFYFFMIRPQQKRQKEIRKFREGIKVGDKVITAGGIYGKVRNINDTTFELEIDEKAGIKIKIDKGSVYPSVADANQAAQSNEK